LIDEAAFAISTKRAPRLPRVRWSAGCPPCLGSAVGPVLRLLLSDAPTSVFLFECMPPALFLLPLDSGNGVFTRRGRAAAFCAASLAASGALTAAAEALIAAAAAAAAFLVSFLAPVILGSLGVAAGGSAEAPAASAMAPAPPAASTDDEEGPAPPVSSPPTGVGGGQNQPRIIIWGSVSFTQKLF
jgi:hypothetical protein